MLCNALYLHIPFCRSKCPYCDFYSLPAQQEQMDAYTAALIRMVERTPHSLASLDTIYFGGGTPSLLGGRRICGILESIHHRFAVKSDAEITIECNPCSADEETLRLLHGAGVNRISMGMQSGSEAQLRLLGRAHTAAQLEQAVNAAHRVGFSRLSLDLMLALPGQTAADFDADVARCAALGAEHVSAYLLKIEPGTSFSRDNVAAICPDEETQAALYLHACDALESSGYRQYEISNFCRNDKISKHNYKYWDTQAYLGLGPSAHSFVGGQRFYFPRDLDAFLAVDDPFSLMIPDGAGGELEEYLMLRLRLREGIVWKSLSKRYPQADADMLRKKARPLVKGGLVMLDADGLRLTRQGMLLSNPVTAALLECE